MPVRRLTDDDIERIREIDATAFQRDDQYETSFYETIVGADHFDALVATDASGLVAGWALVDLSLSPIRIRSLCVDPHLQRRRHGSALIDAILEKHHGQIDLLVDPDNTAAMRLYRSRGFAETAPDVEMPQRVRMILTRRCNF